MLLSVIGWACTPRAEGPPPQEPLTRAPEQEVEAAAEPSDPLDGLRLERAPTTASSPEPIEVVVDAVMTEEEPGAKVIAVGVDPRFTIHIRIERVEPETALLQPDRYAVMIHSPSRTFRGPVPGKGQRIRFRMAIIPANPDDPHDENFFSDLWID